jgi:hypothetical protein
MQNLHLEKLYNELIRIKSVLRTLAVPNFLINQLIGFFPIRRLDMRLFAQKWAHPPIILLLLLSPGIVPF